ALAAVLDREHGHLDLGARRQVLPIVDVLRRSHLRIGDEADLAGADAQEDAEGLDALDGPHHHGADRDGRLDLGAGRGALGGNREADAALVEIDARDEDDQVLAGLGGLLQLPGISVRWSRPSTPGSSSTKTPKSVIRATRPRTIWRSRSRPAISVQGSVS